MSMISSHPRPSVCTPQPARPIEGIVSKAWAAFNRMNDLARSRRTLHGLTDTRLSDIGLSRRAALTEAGKPRWAVPASWGS